APATPEPAATPAPEAPQRPVVEPATAAAAEDASAPSEPAAPEPVAEAPEATESGDKDSPQVNVPSRPTVVKPAGPQIEDEKKKPAKLSGPKIVRIEAPERIEPRRPRGGPGSGPGIPGARGGAGAGVMRGPGMGPPGDDDRRGGPGGGRTRNKRRTTTNRRGKGGEGTGGAGGGEWKPGAWREQDLVEREARLSRAGGFLRQRRREMKLKQQSGGEKATTAAETGGKVRVQAPLTIKDLSAATGVKASEIVKRLFMQGVMASVNSGIESEKAQEIMLEYDIELEVEEQKTAQQVVEAGFEDREMIDERPRAPIVTILGHVDHGKTSLLDKIRKANVAEGEAGGITQATSAFRVGVEVGGAEKQVVFLDTPGHEAFTQMRARGANITDIVVLVVAADDGVMPQTIESINHAKAAEAKIVVALNKIDKPEATDSNIQRILGQLAEHGLNPVEWGGETEIIKTSAQKGTGINDLLEVLEYQAELLELKADFGGPARGTVIEARFEGGRGPVANVLVQDGGLKVGDFIACGRAYGRVRDITDDRGQRLQSAGPATPVQVSGLDELPDAGDKFFIVDSLKKAQDAAEQRRHAERERELAQPKVTLESMLGQMKAGEVKELRVVIKADVQGSVDVLRKAAEDIQNDEVRVRVLHAAVGGVTESDVTLADASQAVIIGFNVIPSSRARQDAEQKNIQIRSYDVIYDIVDDLKKAAEGLLEPEIRQEVLGHAEVRQVFKISKVGAIAGCYVTDGVIERNALIRVTRGDIIIENDRKLEQLKRFKDDVKEVKNGQECGMKIVGYDDIKEGDILECFKRIEVARTL
ncbi:MAG: translation initiation factor IF-2, partial [Phycisphaerales bacterium]